MPRLPGPKSTHGRSADEQRKKIVQAREVQRERLGQGGDKRRSMAQKGG